MRAPGKQTVLDAIQARYRRAMIAVYDLPKDQQAQAIREALNRLAAEKAAVGGSDSEVGDDDVG